MKITLASKQSYWEVFIGDDSYSRYSPDSWWKLYGSSWEPVYDDNDLEDAFQTYLKEIT